MANMRPPMPVPGPGLDLGALTRWLADQAQPVVPPLSAELLSGGNSNITWLLADASGQRMVLRRPPFGPRAAKAHDMAREATILAALQGSRVPVPRLLGRCTDKSVIGAPFYLTGSVDGHVLATAADARALLRPAARYRLGVAMITALADLHGEDIDAAGLGQLGRRENYLQRQLARLQGTWASIGTRDVPAMDEVARLLARSCPQQRHTGIVHGDFRLGNVITGADGTLAAVLDWELCTLGDVLADLGYLLNSWVAPGDPEPTGYVTAPPTAVGGFPRRGELVERYCRQTGFDAAGLGYYRAFSYWRLAVIAAGVKRRYEEGAMADRTIDPAAYGQRVADLAELSLAQLAGAGRG